MLHLISVFYVVTGILGLVTIFLVLSQKKYNKALNFYLLIIFFVCSIRFILKGFTELGLVNFYSNINQKAFMVLIILVPCFYLYSKKLALNQINFNYKELVHFIFPLLLISSNFYIHRFKINKENIFWFYNYLFYSYVIVYQVLVFSLFKKHVWSRSSSFYHLEKHNLIIKRWTKFIFILFLIITLKKIFLEFADAQINRKNSYGDNNLWMTAILFNVIYLKVQISPEILHGYNSVVVKHKKNLKKSFILREVWIINNKIKIENPQDCAVSVKIEESIPFYLKSIENLVFNMHFLRNKDVNLNDISNQLKIPKSHLKYIFKYHSRVSFSDFKKIVRVYDAINLMDKGFLNHNTLEFLSSEVGFSSYKPFFVAFKNVTGFNPKDYNKR